MKILVVDDDELFLGTILGSLATLGYEEIIGALNATDALEIIALAEEPFDCFLFDVRMPGIDGIQLVREIRGLSVYASSPILMVTVVHDIDIVHQAFMAGATDYITKPVDDLQLSTRMRLAEQLHLKNKLLSALPGSLTGSYESARNYDDFSVSHVSGIIDQANLKSYLEQASRFGLFQSAICSVSFPEISETQNATRVSEFQRVLEACAESVVEAFMPYHGIVTMPQTGVFLGLLNRIRLPDYLDLQSEVYEAMLRRDIRYDNGSRVSLDFVLSKPKGFGIMSSRTAIQIVEAELKNVTLSSQKGQLLHAII